MKPARCFFRGLGCKVGKGAYIPAESRIDDGFCGFLFQVIWVFVGEINFNKTTVILNIYEFIFAHVGNEIQQLPRNSLDPLRKTIRDSVVQSQDRSHGVGQPPVES